MPITRYGIRCNVPKTIWTTIWTYVCHGIVKTKLPQNFLLITGSIRFVVLLTTVEFDWISPDRCSQIITSSEFALRSTAVNSPKNNCKGSVATPPRSHRWFILSAAPFQCFLLWMFLYRPVSLISVWERLLFFTALSRPSMLLSSPTMLMFWMHHHRKFSTALAFAIRFSSVTVLLISGLPFFPAIDWFHWYHCCITTVTANRKILCTRHQNLRSYPFRNFFGFFPNFSCIIFVYLQRYIFLLIIFNRFCILWDIHNNVGRSTAVSSPFPAPSFSSSLVLLP